MKKFVSILLALCLVFTLGTASVHAVDWDAHPVFTVTDDSVLGIEVYKYDANDDPISVEFCVEASDTLGYKELVLPFGFSTNADLYARHNRDLINFSITPEMIEAYNLDKTKLDQYYDDLRDSSCAALYFAAEGEDTYSRWWSYNSNTPLIGTGFTAAFGQYAAKWDVDDAIRVSEWEKKAVLVQQETKFAFRIVEAGKPGSHLKDVSIKENADSVLSLSLNVVPELVKGIKLNNTTLTTDQYLVVNNGTALQIDPDLTKGLAAGDHKLTVQFTDNTEKTITLTVGDAVTSSKEESSSKKDTASKSESGENDSKTSPKTGDGTAIALTTLLGLAATAVILTCTKKAKA